MSDLATLTFATAPDVPDTFNVLLYGPPKSGKTTAAATAPGPILWVNAEGAGALGYARKVAAERGTEIHEVRITRGSGDVREVLRQVLEHVRAGVDPAPRTIVVDTLGKTRDAMVKQIVQPGSRNTLQQYGEVNRVLSEFITFLRDQPVNMVLLAHEAVSDCDGERIVEPLIGGALTQFAPGEVDVLAYCGIVTDDDTGYRRYVGQLVEGRGRRAGDRSGGLGSTRDLDVSEWLAAYGAALAPQGDAAPFEAVTA
jgi:AAA domain